MSNTKPQALVQAQIQATNTKPSSKIPSPELQAPRPRVQKRAGRPPKGLRFHIQSAWWQLRTALLASTKSIRCKCQPWVPCIDRQAAEPLARIAGIRKCHTLFMCKRQMQDELPRAYELIAKPPSPLEAVANQEHDLALRKLSSTNA